MTATQIHLRRPEPAAVAPPARGWKLAGPLEGWRDDDPDAYPRCSINPAHMIRNGDRYAVSDIKMACLACAQVSPPAPATPLPAAPKPRAASTVGRKFGAGGHPTPRTAPPVSPRAAVSAPVATKTPGPTEPVLTQPVVVVEPSKARALMAGSELIGADPAPDLAVTDCVPPERPRVRLGPAHRDCGVLIQEPAPRAPQPEERTCERRDCTTTFTVTSDNRHKRFCSNSCSRRHMHATRPPRPPVRVVAIEASVCETCGAEHQPIPVRPRHCSWACVWRAAVSPTPHGVGCLCLSCSSRREEQGLPPLIGLMVTTTYEDRIEAERRRTA